MRNVHGTMMDRRSNSDTDLERGVFLLPNGQPNQSNSPNGSTGSGQREAEMGDDTLSTSRDTESSTTTPSKPLLITRTGSGDLHNGGRHNGYSKTLPHGRASYEANRKKKPFWKGKEHLWCLFGTVTFLIGAIFICVALILFINSHSVSETQSCPSALKNQDSTVSSPLENTSRKQQTVTTSTSTEPTTTFNYDEVLNIASGLEHHAYQSSTHEQEGVELYPASRAVDGGANYTLASKSCSLTKPQLKPFWWLDMQNYKLVKRIRIFKPTDCCDDGLTDFEIRIGQQEELSTNALCKHFPGTNLGQVVEVVCDRQIYGRYVSIQLLGSDGVQRQLALCEVEIYDR